MVYVFSTLTNGTNYGLYIKNGDVAIKTGSIKINGGANLANKVLVTPKGAMTVLEDKQFELLQNDPIFKIHLEKGFITFEKKKADVEDVAKDMTSKDASAPITAGASE